MCSGISPSQFATHHLRMHAGKGRSGSAHRPLVTDQPGGEIFHRREPHWITELDSDLDCGQRAAGREDLRGTGANFKTSVSIAVKS
jgi:hypothetical protein